MIFSNYRPVSMLPVCSKLIERLMYKRLIQNINEKKLLYEYQFGFQRGKSTHMALLVFLDKISEALDRGECVIGMFLDFSKAFDTVDHSILLRKMQKYGIQGLALRWFEDYLHDRKQYVTYNSYKSNQEAIKCDVPQGSILGPLLFLICINDLSSVSEACFSILFADDTNMFITGHNVSEMCNQLNANLFRVQGWLHCNKFPLNVLKTHYMIFTPRNKIYDDISIIIDNTKISRVYVTTFLVVQIDSQLSWKMHIDYICKNYLNAQLYYKRPVRYLENLVLQLFIIHLLIQNLLTATMSGVILTKQIWIDLFRKKWYVLSQDPHIGPTPSPCFMQI